MKNTQQNLINVSHDERVVNIEELFLAALQGKLQVKSLDKYELNQFSEEDDRE